MNDFKIGDIVEVNYPSAPGWNGQGKIVAIPKVLRDCYVVEFERNIRGQGGFDKRYLTLVKPAKFKVGDRVTATVEGTVTSTYKDMVRIDNIWTSLNGAEVKLVRAAAPETPGSVVEINGLTYLKTESAWVNTKGEFASTKEINESDFVVKEIS